MTTPTFIGDIYINNNQDNEIIREILTENGYGIDKRVKLTGTVLDIGAHIGIFSKLALSRGCKVISVEPEDKNFHLLTVNAPGATHIKKAVTSEKRAFLMVHPDRGEMHKLMPVGIPVDTITLDELIGDGTIDLLKIDIEGGEYDAIMTSTKMGQVNQIAMEYHLGLDRAVELINFLNQFGLKPVYISGEDFGQLQFLRK